MCGFDTEWGPCQQDTFSICRYHRLARNPGFREDRYYHKKVALGLVSLTSEYISETEMRALFGGRPRKDGRRIDQWTV